MRSTLVFEEGCAEVSGPLPLSWGMLPQGSEERHLAAAALFLLLHGPRQR